MRIACLQLAPQLGHVQSNIDRAVAVLGSVNPQDLDLLVLPEMAFSGYNFKSFQHISPFLEQIGSGITSDWTCNMALKYKCVVTVGYPEKVDISSPEYCNSAIIVNADGKIIANYRKTSIHYIGGAWALEGPDGFYNDEIPGLGNVAMGIYKWQRTSSKSMNLISWSKFEFAFHILCKEANLAIISMAWMTQQDLSVYGGDPKEPDMDTLTDWVVRLEPLIRTKDKGEIIVVLANRCGTEEEAVYAGTSCVLGIEYGVVKVYGILGRMEEGLLVVDTAQAPRSRLVAEMEVMPEDTAQNHRAPALHLIRDTAKDSFGKALVAQAEEDIDAVIHAFSQLIQHPFFANRDTEFTAGGRQSSSTSISSSPQSCCSSPRVSGEGPSQELPRGPHPTPQESQEMLPIILVSDWNTEHTPDSAAED